MKSNLRTKLLIGFLGMVAIVLFLSAVSFYSLTRINKGTSPLADDAMYLGLVSDMRAAAINLTVPVEEYLRTGDPAEAENFRTQLARVKEMAVKLKERAVDGEQKKLIAEAEATLAEIETAGGLLTGAAPAQAAGMKDEIERFDGLRKKIGATVDRLEQHDRDKLTGTVGRIGGVQKEALKLSLGVSAVAIIAGMVAGFILTRSILRPITELTKVTKDIAGGNLAREVKVTSDDELGELQRAVGGMLGGLRAMVGAINRAAAEVAAASEKVASSAEKVHAGAMAQASAAEESAGGMEDMTTSMSIVERHAEDLAKGAQETSESLTRMAASFGKIEQGAVSMASSVTQTGAAVQEMTASIDKVARNANNLAEAVTGVSSTIQEMAASIRMVANSAASGRGLSRDTAENVEDGVEAVGLTMEGIRKVSDRMGEMTRAMQNLSGRSLEIQEIVALIEELANKSNLLALNAAIVAAKAGSEGDAFAVVAEEVRELASRSTDATKGIKELIGQVRRETAQAVDIAEFAASDTTRGMELAEQAGLALAHIHDSAAITYAHMAEIAKAAEEQAAAAARVVVDVEKMNAATEDVIPTVREQAMGTGRIRDGVDKLKSLSEKVSASVREQAAGGAHAAHAVKSINAMTQEVAAATAEQRRGGETVLKAVEDISATAKENLGAAQEMKTAAEELTLQAGALKQAVGQFKG